MRTFMERIVNMIRHKRSISFLFIALGVAFTAAMLITYALSGISTFTPVLSTKVIVLESICIGLGVLLALFEVKNGKYGLYLLSLWAWLEFLFYEASYISNVLVGIDGNQFSIGFILTTVFGLLAWVCILVSAILQKRELGWHTNLTRKEA